MFIIDERKDKSIVVLDMMLADYGIGKSQKVAVARYAGVHQVVREP